MDIEQLSRSQTVLLTLLVSFVTSIATGIVTVSLMDQAPPVVAQTVNRVIERTVQQVVPDQSAAAATTQTKTVVVNESDLISQAVDRTTRSIVRVYSNDTQPVFLGLGVVVEASGTVATDASILSSSGDALVELPNSSYVHASITTRDSVNGVAYLAPATTTTEGKTPIWTPVSLASQNPTLGEAVVALSGNTVARVADGIITSVIPNSDPTGLQSVVDTSISASSIMSGSPLIDTDGNLIGLSTGSSQTVSSSGFVPTSILIDPLNPASTSQ